MNARDKKKKKNYSENRTHNKLEEKENEYYIRKSIRKCSKSRCAKPPSMTNKTK